MRFT
jgi:hypothetical protein